MQLSIAFRYITWGGILLSLAFLAFWSTRPGPLEFRSLETPRGLRELVVQSQVSRSNPVFGAIPAPETGTEPDALKRDGLSVCDALFRDPLAPVTGRPDSKLGIVEFVDYQCAYCKVLAKILFDVQKDRPQVRMIYKEWPILGERSRLAARAALAAARQGKYQQFHARLMRSRVLVSDQYIAYLASELGLDLERLRRDMDAPGIARGLDRNSTLAKKLGLVGTPALIVGRTLVRGAIPRARLDQLLDVEMALVDKKIC